MRRSEIVVQLGDKTLSTYCARGTSQYNSSSHAT